VLNSLLIDVAKRISTAIRAEAILNAIAIYRQSNQLAGVQ
jgi:hypothetical protein